LQREQFRATEDAIAPTTAQFEPVAERTMTEEARPVVNSYQEPRRQHSEYDEEQVREIPQRMEPKEEAVPAGAGFAPAAPVKIDWPSDLQQVESDPEKIRSVQQAAVVQDAPVSRPRRVRQPSQPVADEPLVQIETDRPR
jgi:hypothetical protein